jgi:hypothetical protein
MNREALNHRPTVAHCSPALRQAEHDDIEAQMIEYERLGGRVEHIADGVCTEDPSKRNGKKEIQVVKGKR